MYTCNISLSQVPYAMASWRGGGSLKRGFGGPDRQVGLLRLGGVYLGSVIIIIILSCCMYGDCQGKRRLRERGGVVGRALV